jgi:hypothetical protein
MIIHGIQKYINTSLLKSLHFRGMVIYFLLITVHALAQPIQLYPDNPHYYLYKNRPILLITSAEHYGALINGDFDYIEYFKTLQSYHLNYTRIYPGILFEPVDKWIKDNTLAPKQDGLILPWARSSVPGYVLGGNKFDLGHWNEKYFNRLKNLIGEAGNYGIIVEICFFNAQYDDTWPISPLFYKNNIQGIGNCSFNDVQTIKDTALLVKEADYVKKILLETNAYDNVIYEICDEPTINGTPDPEAGLWLEYFAKLLKNTEKSLPKKHLLAQQIEGPLNGPCDFSENSMVQIIVGQYAWMAYGQQEGGIKALDDKYYCNKPIELNETYYYPVWYLGDSIADSRVEAWEFIVGGGASFNHLNGRFTSINPSGLTPDNKKVLAGLKNLASFMNKVDYIKMKPDKSFITSGLSPGTFWRGMSLPGHEYIAYLHHSIYTKDSSAYIVTPGNYSEQITFNLEKENYLFEWIEPASGELIMSGSLDCSGDHVTLPTPSYSVDIALHIKREK